jgi:hypothetical protein
MPEKINYLLHFIPWQAGGDYLSNLTLPVFRECFEGDSLQIGQNGRGKTSLNF